MGTEQSTPSSGVFPDLPGCKIKVTGISDLQLDGEAFADVVDHGPIEVLVENELEGHPSELEETEARSTKEAPSGETQETKGNVSGEENLGQSVQEQGTSGGSSIPEETPKAQVHRENQEDEQPVLAPKSVTDTVEEPKVASEICGANCGTGDNAEGVEAQPRDLTPSDKAQRAEQAHGLEVGEPYLEPILAHQAQSAACEQPAGISAECELANANMMTLRLLQSDPALTTNEILNFIEENHAMPASTAQALLEWASPQPSAKTWVEVVETREPSFTKQVDKACPDEPASEKTEAPQGADSAEGWLPNEGPQVYIELAITPGTCQAEPPTVDAEGTKGCSGGGGSPVSDETSTDAPNEEPMALRPLYSKRKARFCCTIL